MRWLTLTAFVFVLTLSTLTERGVVAAAAPEALLGQESLAYLRYDGIAAHRDSYDKTAFAQVLNEEFQPLIDTITKMIYDAIGPQVLSERLLQGLPPAKLIRLQKSVKLLPAFVSLLKERGVAAGVEVIDPARGRYHITVVFPVGGEKTQPEAVLGAFRLLAYLAEGEVRDTKIGGRVVLEMKSQHADFPGRLHCWKEGPHAVLTIGTEGPKRTIDLAEGKRVNVTGHPLYKQLISFRSYETIGRGFADAAGVLKLTAKAAAPVAGFLSQLGLDGLNSVTFHVGFDGKLQRSTIALNMPGERKGVLKLLSPPGQIDVSKLPPLPPDVAMVSMVRTDLLTVYDEILNSIRLAAALENPGNDKEVERVLKRFERSLGIDIRKDLFAALGQNMVLYSTPSEGAFFFSSCFMVEVKDAAKLKKTMDTLIRSASTSLGLQLTINRRKYRGATLNVVQTNQQGFPFPFTYAVHKGWFALSFYPQPVMGYVYRSGGKTPVWKSPALLARALREAEQGKAGSARVTAVTVADPRHAVKQILALAPLFASFIRTAGEGLQKFDLSVIPNAQAVSDRLFENVTVIVDDKNSVRMETYASIPVPAQLTGLDFYLAIPLYQVFRFGF